MGYTSPMVDLQPKLDAITVCLRENRFAAAVQSCRDLLAAEPKQPDALYILGLIAFQMQQPAQALEWMNLTLEQAPKMAAAWLLRARVLRMLRRPDEAFEAATRSVQLAPQLADTWHCAGFMAMALGRWDIALADLEQAVALVPDSPVLRSQYALALNENNRNEAAYSEVQIALRQAPQHPEILMTKADILDGAGYYDIGVRYRPVDRIVTFNQAANVFLTGDFRRGLILIADRNEAMSPSLPMLPKWRGEEDFGLHLILTGEQGYGDILQFLRYVAPARERVGKLSLRVPQPLVRLLQYNMPNLTFIPFKYASQEKAPPPSSAGIMPDEVVPPDAGAQSRLMSLPTFLNPTFDPRASAVPYLRADPSLAAIWRERLASVPRPWIGIAWSGNPRHTNDHKRSIPLNDLLPLIKSAENHFVSLQAPKDKAPDLGWFEALPFIKDFADTAALFEVLDLVITIDSAPAHLAGAMGRPVWTLLPFNPDWRWLLGREDSVWYPTMRLFRQKKPGDWGGIIENIIGKLKNFRAGDTSVLKPQAWEGPPLKRHPLALPLTEIEAEEGFK
jgi:tetratricopeptide (TPR) repeat protein